MVIRFLFYSTYSLLKLLDPKLKSYDDDRRAFGVIVILPFLFTSNVLTIFYKLEIGYAKYFLIFFFVMTYFLFYHKKKYLMICRSFELKKYQQLEIGHSLVFLYAIFTITTFLIVR